MPGLGEAVLAVLDDILALLEGVSNRSSGLCRGVAFGLVSFRVDERALGRPVRWNNDAGVTCGVE